MQKYAKSHFVKQYSNSNLTRIAYSQYVTRIPLLNKIIFLRTKYGNSR